MKHNTKKRKNNQPGHFSTKRFLKVTFTYFLLFLALLGMIDYYAMMIYNFALVFGIAILLALPAGYLHIKKGRHTHIDDVADEIL